MNASFLIKIGETFRTLLKFDNLDWCNALKNFNQLAKSNRFVKPAYKDIKAIAPIILRPCPFYGDFRLLNVPSAENVMSILPAADFIGRARIKDVVKKCDVIIEVKFTKFN